MIQKELTAGKTFSYSAKATRQSADTAPEHPVLSCQGNHGLGGLAICFFFIGLPSGDGYYCLSSPLNETLLIKALAILEHVIDRNGKLMPHDALGPAFAIFTG